MEKAQITRMDAKLMIYRVINSGIISSSLENALEQTVESICGGAFNPCGYCGHASCENKTISKAEAVRILYKLSESGILSGRMENALRKTAETINTDTFERCDDVAIEVCKGMKCVCR